MLNLFDLIITVITTLTVAFVVSGVIVDEE